MPNKKLPIFLMSILTLYFISVAVLKYSASDLVANGVRDTTKEARVLDKAEGYRSVTDRPVLPPENLSAQYSTSAEVVVPILTGPVVKVIVATD